MLVTNTMKLYSFALFKIWIECLIQKFIRLMYLVHKIYKTLNKNLMNKYYKNKYIGK